MYLSEAEIGSAAVFMGFEGSDEELEKVMELGFSVGVMVMVRGKDEEGVLVEFEDGRKIKVDINLAKKILVNPV